MDRLEIPAEIRRRKRGCKPGVKHQEKRIWYKPSILSVIMENMRSLPSKIEDLMVLARLQSNYHECSILCFSKTYMWPWIVFILTEQTEELRRVVRERVEEL